MFINIFEQPPTAFAKTSHVDRSKSIRHTRVRIMMPYYLYVRYSVSCFSASITVHLPLPGKTASVTVLCDIGGKKPGSHGTRFFFFW